MSWEKFEKDIDRGPASASFALGKLGLWLALAVVMVVVVVGFVWKPFDVVSTVTNTDRMLYNYEYFYNQAEARRAIQRKIDQANLSVTRFEESLGPRSEWGYEDKTEHARLVTLSDGLKFQCADIVADYNAKAKQVTRSIFKTDSTPYQLQECE